MNALTRTESAFPKDYQIVFEITGKAAMMVGEDTTISLVNAEFERLSGYSKKEIEGKKSWTEFVARDDRKRARDYYRFRKTDSMLVPRRFEFQFIDGQGKATDVISTIGLLPEMNKIMASLETVQRENKELGEERTAELVKANKALRADITERKRTEKKLRESEERYRSLVNHIPLGINLVDSDHHIIMVNAVQGKNFNKPVSELIGKNCFREFEKRDAVCAHCPGVQAMATGKTAEVESEGIRDDGSRFYVRIQAFPVFGQDGTATGFIEFVEDITERKQIEEQLRESEERFRMLADDAPFGISIMAPDRTFEYLNPRFTEIFGYTKKDIPDKATWFAKAYPDEEYRKGVFSLWERDLAEGVKIEKENPRVFTVRCKNGEDKIIDFRTVYLKDCTQYLTYEDITDRVKAEEELKKSEELYRRLIETTKVGVSAIDERGVITYANERFCEIWGYSVDEIMGCHVFDFLDEENLKILKEHLAKRRKGESESYEIAWRRKDGQNVSTILTPTPIFDADGNFKGSYGFITDITERKKMEKELRQSEERFRLLVETMRVGLSAVDTKGVITYVNDQMCQMLGYTMEEIIGRPTTDFYDEESRKLQEAVFAKRRKGLKDPTPYEVTWVAKDGHKVSTIITPTPSFSPRGEFTGSFALFTDITERKRIEERLQRYAADLERSNEEVKNFAYIVSHDLRVPLVNLKGYSAELRSALGVVGDNFDAALPYLNEEKRSAVAMALHEDVPEALEFITNSVTRMDGFINAVLQLSRLGRRDLKPEPLDMNALLKPIVEAMSHQIQEQGITITVGALPEVIADRTAMEQIMGNILGNAVKYLDHERPGQIEVAGQVNGEETIFRIRDNGRGIAAEDMDKVFAPFRRAGKQDTPGEGMGLAYVQTLVRRHNGRIRCESELGKGSTFSFTIANQSKQGVRHV